MAMDGEQSHKSHRSRQSGPTAKKKSKSDKKKKGASDENQKQHNPKVLPFFSIFLIIFCSYIVMCLVRQLYVATSPKC